MSPEQIDPQVRDRSTRPGWIRFVWWPLSIVLTFYMVTLSLICIDEYFLNHQLVLRPMQTYTPDLIEPLCRVCEAVYVPVALIMQALQMNV